MSLSIRAAPAPKGSPVAAPAGGAVGAVAKAGAEKEGGGIDLVFVIDETGSMGSEINAVKDKVLEIMRTISQLPLCQSLRYGLIGYRDHCDAWAVKVKVPLTDNIKAMETGVKSMGPSGGGDYPEAVTDGLFELLRMDWRPAAAKCAVLVADAPPHGVGGIGDDHPKGCPCGEQWMEQCESMKECGIVLHTVGCRTLREPQVFQAMSKATNGQYFHLAQATKLPKLITGVADHDLDKLRVRQLIMRCIVDHIANLLRIRNEEDRCAALLSELRLRKVEPRSVDTTAPDSNTGEYKLVKRDVQVADINEACANIRRLKLYNRMNEVFPSWGAVQPREKGGLFDKNSKGKGSVPGGPDVEHLSLVPLTGVAVAVRIKGGWGCEVEVAQCYVNNTDTLIDAVYKFPLDELAAVTGFVAEIDGKRIVAKCMAKEKAQKVYQAAVASGQGAFLLEQKKADVFQMTVGNLLPGQQVIIRVSYIQLLEREQNGAYRFLLPTTVAPRYVAPRPANDTAAAADEKKGAAGAAGGARHSDYALAVRLDLSMHSELTSVTSPSHNIVSALTGRTGTCTLEGEDAEMDRDLVVVIQEKSQSGAAVFLEKWTPEELGEGLTETTTMGVDTSYDVKPVNGQLPVPQPKPQPRAVPDFGETGGGPVAADAFMAPAAPAAAAVGGERELAKKRAAPVEADRLVAAEMPPIAAGAAVVAASRAPMPMPVPLPVPMPHDDGPAFRRRIVMPIPMQRLMPPPQRQRPPPPNYLPIQRPPVPVPVPVKPNEDKKVYKDVGDLAAMFVFNPTFTNGWAPLEAAPAPVDRKEGQAAAAAPAPARQGEADHPGGEGVAGAAAAEGKASVVPLIEGGNSTLEGGDVAIIGQPDVRLLRQNVNLIVLVDCSASMAGIQTDMVTGALHALTKRLGALPPNSSVQCFKFGHEFKLIWANSNAPAIAQSAGTKPLHGLGSGALTADQKRKDHEFVMAGRLGGEPAPSQLAMDADMGGTQLLRVLRRLEHPRAGVTDAIVLLTDGDVTELDAAVAFLKARPRTECYPIGVGHTMNHHNLRELAGAVPVGAAEFCLPGESVAHKLDRQLQRVYAGLTQVTLKWSNVTDAQGKAIPEPPVAPGKFPCITSGSHVITFALLRDGEKGTLTLAGQNHNGEKFSWALTADSANYEGEVQRGQMLPRLAGRALMRHYEASINDKALQENAIVPIAVNFTLASKYTSFVAVDERSEEDKKKALDAYHEKQKLVVAAQAAKREESQRQQQQLQGPVLGALKKADAKPGAMKEMDEAKKGGARGGVAGARGRGGGGAMEKLKKKAAPARSLRRKAAAAADEDDDSDGAIDAEKAEAEGAADPFASFGGAPPPAPAAAAHASTSSLSRSSSRSSSSESMSRSRLASPKAASAAAAAPAAVAAELFAMAPPPPPPSAGLDLLDFASAPSAASVAPLAPMRTMMAAAEPSMPAPGGGGFGMGAGAARFGAAKPSAASTGAAARPHAPATAAARNSAVSGGPTSAAKAAPVDGFFSGITNSLFGSADAKQPAAGAAAAAGAGAGTPVSGVVRCGKGHLMDSYRDRVPSTWPEGCKAFNCDVCGAANVAVATGYYHCMTCGDYDTCEKCVAAQRVPDSVVVKCRKGHNTTAYRNRWPATYPAAADPRYNCDVCGLENLKTSTDYRHCDECKDYDCCPDCLWSDPNARAAAAKSFEGNADVPKLWAELLAAALIDAAALAANGGALRKALIAVVTSWLAFNGVKFTPAGAAWPKDVVLTADQRFSLLLQLKTEAAKVLKR